MVANSDLVIYCDCISDEKLDGQHLLRRSHAADGLRLRQLRAQTLRLQVHGHRGQEEVLPAAGGSAAPSRTPTTVWLPDEPSDGLCLSKEAEKPRLERPGVDEPPEQSRLKLFRILNFFDLAVFSQPLPTNVSLDQLILLKI